MLTLRPEDNVYAFYDGRSEGKPYNPADPSNWVDRGALSLGIASFAIVDGDEALVYDAQVSVHHGRAIRATLEAAGVQNFTVVLSHKHLDHVAGTAAFADCEIIANERTAECLIEDAAAIEDGTLLGPPAISPLIHPNRTFSDRLSLTVGSTEVQLIHFNIHSDDETVVWLPDSRTLLAGDTLEDTVTYVAEPDNLAIHLTELDRLKALGPALILPCHGDPELIAGPGYSTDLIDATQDYVRLLLRSIDEPDLRAVPLQELLADQLAAGSITYFAGYEPVHQSNLKAVLGAKV